MFRRTLFWLFTLVTVSFTQLTVAASINASVDRARISFDETIVLSIRVSPQSSASPNFSELETQFDILGRNQNSQYRNINGQIEAFTEWQLTLAPKSAGKLVIPSFQYEKNFSDAIILEVSEAKTIEDTTLLPDIFLEVQAENTSPFVQQQVIVTIKLHNAVPLRVDDAPALNMPNALLLPLQDSQYQKRVGDKIYSVYELRYALFPQISGELEIPIQTYTVTARLNTGNTQRQDQIQTKRVRSKPITLKVKPQPKQYQDEHWLPAAKIDIKDQWSTNDNSWVVGEPITRKIQLNVVGLSGNQIPALILLESDHYKQYREKPEQSDHQDARGISTEIIETIAIVPTKEGELTLPEVRLTWWDTTDNSKKVVTLPAKRLIVKPNPNVPIISNVPATAQTPPDIEQPSVSSAPSLQLVDESNRELLLWRGLCLILLLTNLVTGGLLFLRHRKPSAQKTIQGNTTINPADLSSFQAMAPTAFTRQKAGELLKLINNRLPDDTLKRLADSDSINSMLEQKRHLNAYAYGDQAQYEGDLELTLHLLEQIVGREQNSIQPDRTLLQTLYPS